MNVVKIHFIQMYHYNNIKRKQSPKMMLLVCILHNLFYLLINIFYCRHAALYIFFPENNLGCRLRVPANTGNT